MTMDPASIFTLGVTATGAAVSVVKTVKQIKDFVHDYRHVDEKIDIFVAEVGRWEQTLTLIEVTVKKAESTPAISKMVSPTSVIGESLAACHAAASSLDTLFHKLGKRKVLKELKLRSQSGDIAEFRRRFTSGVASLQLQVMNLTLLETQYLSRELRVWKKDWSEQSRTLQHIIKNSSPATQRLFDDISVAIGDDVGEQQDFRGYVIPTRLKSTEQWIGATAFAGPPPTEASYPATIAFPDEASDETFTSAEVATVFDEAPPLVSNEVKKAKLGLLKDGLSKYDIGHIGPAHKNLQQACETWPDVSVTSLDEEMTEQRINSWLCLSKMKLARLSDEPQRTSLMKGARQLLARIQAQKRASSRGKDGHHIGRHMDALLLAEIYVYTDDLSEAERTCIAAAADIESSVGIEQPIFYAMVLTMATIYYAKGHTGPAKQWMKRLSTTWLQTRVAPFLTCYDYQKDVKKLYRTAIAAEKLDVAYHLLCSHSTLWSDLTGPNFLYEAAMQGSPQMVTFLVASGRSINAIGRTDAKILTVEQIRKLLTSSFLQPQTDGLQDRSPLTIAIQMGHLSTVKVLLDLGADLESLEMHGTSGNCVTPLGLAVEHDQKDIVKLLLERGAKPNPRPPILDTWSSLQLVYSIQILQPLDLSIKNGKKWDDDTWSNSSGPLLIERGADVDCNNLWDTPLNRALDRHNGYAVRALVAAGANVNTRKYLGDREDDCIISSDHSPLHKAILSCLNIYFPGIIEDLLKHGADVDYTRKSSNDTPLMLAIKIGATDVVKLLLHYRAKPDPPDSRQCSPLLLAIDLNKPEIVELLVRHGASTTRLGCLELNDGKREQWAPIDLAKDLKRRRIQKIFAQVKRK